MNNLAFLFGQSLRRHRRLYLIAFLFSFVVAFGLLHFLSSPMWQASGLVRIGKAPSSGGKESFALEQLMSVESSMALLRQEAAADKDIAPNEKWSFQVKPSADGMLILKVQAESSQRAAEIYDVLLGRLKAIHDELFTTRKEFWVKQYAQILADIEDEKKIRESQLSICTQFTEKAIESRLLCADMLARESDRQERNKMFRSKMQEALLPVWSYQTGTTGTLDLSSEPVSPKTLISAALSLSIALAFVAAVLLISSIWAVLGMRDQPLK